MSGASMGRSWGCLGRVTRRVRARVLGLTLGVTVAGCGPSDAEVMAANEAAAIESLAGIFYAVT